MRKLWCVLAAVVIAEPVSAACVRGSLVARYRQPTVLTQPGDTVRLPMYIRNVDTCDCPQACWSMSYGVHYPHDGSTTLLTGRASLETVEGRGHPNWLCLAPGEATELIYVLPIKVAQHAPPAFTTPSVFFIRDDTLDFLVERTDAEGAALCWGYTAAQCRQKSYATAPPRWEGEIPQ